MAPKTHTFADAAYAYLLENPGSVHYKDLTRLVLEKGYFFSRGKTPEQTLRSQLSREIAQKGDEARFVNEAQGVISLSPFGSEKPDAALLEQVRAFAAELEQAAAGAAEVVAPVAEEAPDLTLEAAPEEAPEAPSSAAVAVAAPEPSPAFVPLELEEVEDGEDEEFFADTFATEERDPVVHAAPDEDDELDESSSELSLAPARLEEDSDQDFLSVGTGIGEMTSHEYEASMDELAPIVVPPHEGGAAEIARLPLGGRSVLIVKVVRRQGQPQIQLVEELESLISGVVGRLLLTLPGEDLELLLATLDQTRKVIDASFVAGSHEGSPHDLYAD